MPKGFFDIENVSNSSVRMHINGIIGDWGNSSEDVIYRIENNRASDVEVIIQSPGGSAFEGIAIHNALMNHPGKVITRVLGAAASAGSIIFMAGQERVMPRNTYLMIHEPSVRINGKAKELREAADFLEGITKALHATYAPKVSIDDEQLMAMIMAESWIRADDAVAMGFATDLDDQLEAVALSSDFQNYFSRVPEALTTGAVSTAIQDINSVKDLENCLRESGGFSKGLATALVSKARSILRSESVDNTEAIYNELKSFNLDLGEHHA